MAYCDYHHCAVCDGKAFYDAEVNWPSMDVVSDGFGVPISVVALCVSCYQTHQIVVRKRPVKASRSTDDKKETSR